MMYELILLVIAGAVCNTKSSESIKMLQFGETLVRLQNQNLT